MAKTSAAPSDPLGRGHGAGLRYGLLGLPLAFVALPLYVHLPHVYASRYGMPLATLGVVLLLARLFDAITDPLLGRLGDRLYARSPRWVLGAGAAASVLLVLGMVLLFFPPWAQPGDPAALLGVLMLTCLAFSLLAITHQSWGARLGGDEVQRARIVAWREGAGLVGVVLASVLPTWLGWGEWIAVFAVALTAGCWAWSRSSRPPATESRRNSDWWQDLLHPWRYAPFRRLMAVFVLSGMASAVPATLVLFFIQDRLGAGALEPLFLATYFVAAAASMPLWMRGVARWGLSRCWLAGMLLSVAVFAWAATLSGGDVAGFGGVDDVEDHPRYEERGEHRRAQTDEQRDGESFDRSRSELEEEQGGDDRGQVRVDDRGERARETLRRSRRPVPRSSPPRAGAPASRRRWHCSIRSSSASHSPAGRAPSTSCGPTLADPPARRAAARCS